MKPRTQFAMGENCDLAIAIGRQLGFSLVGISGSDICRGNKKYILGALFRFSFSLLPPK